MKIQISSGQGPGECELAVAKFYNSLTREMPDLRLLRKIRGKNMDGFLSVILESELDLTFLDGAILWICRSPYRKEHKRKNWYVDVSILAEVPSITIDGGIKLETFHSGGRGGQHVNKAETGVRITHIPTGISVMSTEARSQHLNRKIAEDRLCNIISELGVKSRKQEENLAWMEHSRIIRGNPIRVYEGIDFIRKR